MNNRRTILLLGIPLLVVVCALSLATPWSELGSLAKQVLFPFLIAAICTAIFSVRIFVRILFALAIVLSIALFSALRSNGFDWRMDHEWDLVWISFAIQAAFGLFGITAAKWGLSAWSATADPIASS